MKGVLPDRPLKCPKSAIIRRGSIVAPTKVGDVAPLGNNILDREGFDRWESVSTRTLPACLCSPASENLE